jgi:hypothetical protein
MDCFALFAMTMWREQARQIDPTGKSVKSVQPFPRKYFCFRFPQITSHHSVSRPEKEGRWPSSRTLGRVAVDAAALRALVVAGWASSL